MERCRRGGANELTEKLLQHPILSWVQAALSDDYQSASQTLYCLAMEEVELAPRKKVWFLFINSILETFLWLIIIFFFLLHSPCCR